MDRYLTRNSVIAATLVLSAAPLCSKADPPACQVNPQQEKIAVEVRDQPSPSARLITRINPNETEVRELDIMSRGPQNNDWIQIQSGVTTGWVSARQFQCRLSPEDAKRTIATESSSVIRAFETKDMNGVASYVHPVKGVRFSPSATIGAQHDITLTASQIRSWFRDAAQRVWGAFDGSGAPIRLTASEYYNKFVYDRPFANAPVIRFNSSPARSTDRNNLWEVYPNAIAVEYYFPPSSPDGNDWASLRLVYEKQAGRWFLSGVIHDTWTI